MGHVFTDARPLSSSAIIRTWKKGDGALLSASSVAFHGIPQRVETRGKNPFSFSTRGKWGNVRNWTGITQMILRISSFSSFTSSYWTRWSIWKIRYTIISFPFPKSSSLLFLLGYYYERHFEKLDCKSAK